MAPWVCGPYISYAVMVRSSRVSPGAGHHIILPMVNPGAGSKCNKTGETPKDEHKIRLQRLQNYIEGR